MEATALREEGALPDTSTREILPPPFAFVEEPFSEAENILPSRVRVTPEGEILRQSIVYAGLANDIIASYNNALYHGIPQRVGANIAYLSDGTTIHFTGVTITPPKVSTKTGESEDLYPDMARIRGITYGGTVYVDMEQRSSDGTVIATEKHIDIGKIPVMLGSSIDHMSAKNASRSQRLRMGECTSSPGGYFLIKDNSWVILLMDKLRINRIFCYPDKNGDIFSRMTCTTPRGTAIVTMAKEGDGVIRMSLPRITKAGNINVLRMFRVLGVASTRESIIALLSSFIKKDSPRRVFFHLQTTLIDYEASPYNDVDMALQVRGIDLEEHGSVAASYLEDVIQELYPHITGPGAARDKGLLLALNLVQYLRTLSGQRQADDKNDWGNKRLDTPGRLIVTHFGSTFDSIVAKAHAAVEKAHAGDVKVLLSAVRQHMPSNFKDLFDEAAVAAQVGRKAVAGRVPLGILRKNIPPELSEVFEEAIHRVVGKRATKTASIQLASMRQHMAPSLTESFEKAFTRQAWGPQGEREQGSVSELYKNETLVSALSHIQRITSKVNRKTKRPETRAVSPSQQGYVDPFDTPEGSPCGLVKNKAITCWISLSRSENDVRAMLVDRMFSSTTSDANTFALVNGKPLGWCAGIDTQKYLRGLKRSGSLDFDTSIFLSPDDGCLHIHTDEGRPTRPLFVVEDNVLVIDRKNLWGEPFQTLLREGCVEYVDAWEQDYAIVAETVEDLRASSSNLAQAEAAFAKAQADMEEEGLGPMADEDNRRRYDIALSVVVKLRAKKPFDYCEIHPSSVAGVSGSLIPFPNRNPTTKNTGACKMLRQAAGITSSVYRRRFDESTRVLTYPQRPITQTLAYDVLGLSSAPFGENVILAIATVSGFNQEDSIVMNQASIDRGLFRMTFSRSYSAVVNPIKKTDDGVVTEKFQIPTKRRHPEGRIYGNLTERGIARVGSNIVVGDCIIAKVSVIVIDGVVKETDESIYAHRGEEGTVDATSMAQSQGKTIARVKIRQMRRPIVGDKFAAKSAQKSVISAIYSQEDMPFREKDGVVPDVIMNPHAIPSRMTMGLVAEMLGSRVSALSGEVVDATAFEPFEEERFKKYLISLGYTGGKDTMIDGRTGEVMEGSIWMAPIHYLALRHQVAEKIQERGVGPVRPDSRQPVSGKVRTGGLRFGVMERTSIEAHGAAYFLQDRLCLSSDATGITVCSECGMMVMENYVAEKYICPTCGEGTARTCTIPHAYKLLMQRMAGASIKLSFKTKEQYSGRRRGN